MMGFPFIVDEAVKWFWPAGKEWLAANLSAQRRRNIEIALMLAGIFLAGFLAFKAEHLARLDAERITAGPATAARILSKQQRERLSSSLKIPATEHYAVEFNSVPNCEECEEYAQDFRDFISTLPGWKAGGSTLVFSMPYQIGLRLVLRSDEKSSVVAERIRAGFADAKIALLEEPVNDLTPGRL